jgi:hypothetical protein
MGLEAAAAKTGKDAVNATAKRIRRDISGTGLSLTSNFSDRLEADEIMNVRIMNWQFHSRDMNELSRGRV